LRAKVIRACSLTALQDDLFESCGRSVKPPAFDFQRLKLNPQSDESRCKSFANISPERQRDEIFKILEGPNPMRPSVPLEMLGVFSYLCLNSRQ